ncbi:MAG: SOS response-associated peptidase [Mycobacteriales bacterium]|nr:SOS response-associated peptidase [Frankia sp.]
MCGRYASSRPPDVLAGHYGADLGDIAELRASWNVAPTMPVAAVVARPPEGGEEPRRELRAMRWGLVPSWADDPSVGSRFINARAETVADKVIFRQLLRRRRCLIPADGFYEWLVLAQTDRQPFFITSRDGAPLSFAGLYDEWRDPAAPDEPSLWSCTIVTTAANQDVAFLHDRMPVILRTEDCDAWLAATEDDVAPAVALLRAPARGTLAAHPVSRAVGDVRNDGPHLTDAVAFDQPLTLFDPMTSRNPEVWGL